MADLSREREALSSNSRWLAVVGIGEDGREGLSPAALGALQGAAHVFGGQRHLALASPYPGQAHAWPSPIDAGIAQVTALRGEPVCVLATGDPFHYGIGSVLARHVPAAEMAVYPQPSSFSLACARLGLAQQDCALVSLHGRDILGIVRHLVSGQTVLALSWDGSTPEAIARLLVEHGFGRSTLTVLERLGGPHERIRSAVAQDFALRDIAALNLVAIDNLTDPGVAPPHCATGQDDDLFEHDGQLTKAEVRAATLSALKPLPHMLLWDIGAGSGSIAIEWCRSHPTLRAIAIERTAARAARIARNRERFGAVGLTIREGEAPAALSGLEPPDRIFIGGGITRPGLLDAAWAALRPGGLLVANVVSLEGEERLFGLFRAHGGRMRRIAVSHLDPVGRMHGFRPAMAVTQWILDKP